MSKSSPFQGEGKTLGGQNSSSRIECRTFGEQKMKQLVVNLATISFPKSKELEQPTGRKPEQKSKLVSFQGHGRPLNLSIEGSFSGESSSSSNPRESAAKAAQVCEIIFLYLVQKKTFFSWSVC